MASTTAMFTGLTGLNAHSRRLEVIGNNISNVNTTAFKSSRLMFQSQFARTFALGTAPGVNSGGTNPGQVGLGVAVSGTQRNMTGGSISLTGLSTDLAIEGAGMFVVQRNGGQYYTRAGAFERNQAGEIITPRGDRLMGYGVDANMNVLQGPLQPIRVPLGELSIAEATTRVQLAGNLNADGEVATAGTELTFSPLEAGGNPITGATLLTAIDGVPAAPFALNDTITIQGAMRDGKVLPTQTFTITAGSTVDDLMGFLTQALGIVPGGGTGDPLSPEPGGYEIIADGQIVITGNLGKNNELTLNAENFRIADENGNSKPVAPFQVSRTADATGESVRHSFVVYDSLGTMRTVEVTMVMSHRDDSGTYWRAFMHSDENPEASLALQTSTNGVFGGSVPLLHFDNFGELVDPQSIGVSLNLDGSGAAAPLQFEMRFATGTSRVTAFSNISGISQLAAVERDGVPFGILDSFGISADGRVIGGFSNGLTRELGQVVLASFSNPEGLVDMGSGLFSQGPNSGEAVIAEPGTFGTGAVIGGGLELSNVDLGKEFIDMIMTQTGYSASTRVITTSDQLLQQLISMVR
jgi:flagellar hook protein FlgE